MLSSRYKLTKSEHVVKVQVAVPKRWVEVTISVSQTTKASGKLMLLLK